MFKFSSKCKSFSIMCNTKFAINRNKISLVDFIRGSMTELKLFIFFANFLSILSSCCENLYTLETLFTLMKIA